LIMGMHYPPYLDSIENLVKYSAQVNTFLGAFYFTKLFFMFELMRHHSPLNTSKGRFVGSLSKIPITNSFLIKTWVKMNPFVSIGGGTFLFLAVATYFLYITERNS